MAGRIAGLTIEIGADATPLNKAIRSVDSQLRSMQSGLRDVDRLMKFNPTSTQLITQKQQLLKQSIEQTKGKLDQLKEAQAKMDAAGVDKNSREYQNLQREIIATEGQLKNLQKQYNQVASVAGVKLQAMGAQLKEVGAKISAAGQAITKDLTAPIVALGAASIKAFSDVDKGMDSIVQKTGATGQALESMKDSAKNLATTIPTDFKTAGDAVGQVNTRFKLTGDELESVSGQFVKFAKMNNTDVSTSINSVQSAMAAFGVSSKETGAFLDTLNAVGQNTGADMNRLAQEMTTNAASLKAMGYSASDAANFLGQLSVNGVDSSQVMAGLKRAFAQAAKEGKPLDQKLAELQDTMKNADTDTEAYASALELFGNRAGPALASAIRDGRLSLEQLGTSLQDNVGNIDRTFENTLDPVDKFKMALNQAKAAGADLGGSLLNTLTPMIEKLQTSLANLGAKFKSLSPDQQEMIVKIGLIAAAVGPAVLIIGKLTSAIGSVVTVVGQCVTKIAALSSMIGISVGPLLAGAAAIAALGVASYKAYEGHKKQIESQHQLSASQKEAIDGLNQTVDAYKEVQKAADEKNAATAAEFNHVRELKDEYNSLVDSNGKIAEGDKARAEVIIGELASALGMEKSQIEDLIGKNGKLAGSIDNVIKKKEAQAYLDANYDSYVKAIQLETESNQKLAKAISTVNSAEKGVASAQAALTTAQNNLNNARASGARNTTQLSQKVRDAEIALEAEKKKLSEAQGAVDKYSNASKDASNKIANYQKLQEAVQSGSLKKIGAAMTGYQNNLKTTTTATKAELDKQAKATKEDYEAMKKAYSSGDATKKAVEWSKKRADAAAAEAAKVSKAMGTVGSKTKGAMDDASKGVNKIKGKFPVNVGNMIKGSVSYPSMTAKIAEIGKGVAKALFPKISASISTLRFAKAYNTPMLFNSPTIYGGALFGDRGSTAGGEMVYGRDNLMRDIQTAVSGVGGVTINMTVNGVNDARQIANDVIHELEVATRAM